MKMMRKAHTLDKNQYGQSHIEVALGDVQTYDAEEDDKVEVKDVCDSQCEAEEYAHHSGPVSRAVSFLLP